MTLDRTVRLGSLSLFDISILPQTTENILDNLGLMRGRCTAKDVELNVKPIIDTLVNGMVFCAKLFRCYAFFEGFGFGGSSVFILSFHEPLSLDRRLVKYRVRLTEPQIYNVGKPRALL